MENSFYVRSRGKVEGPHAADALRLMARKGQFSRMHEVSRDGTQWMPASEVPELFGTVAKRSANAGANGTTSTVAAPPKEKWYYGQNGKSSGPVDFPELAEKFPSGQISPDASVWRDGMPDWVPAASVPGLLPARPAANVVHVERVEPTRAPVEADDSVPAAAIDAFAACQPWVMFVAVVGYVAAALFAASGVLWLAIGPGGAARGALAIGVVVNLVTCGLLAFGAMLLHSHHGAISKLRMRRTHESLKAAVDALRSFWTYVGILLIVYLVLVAIGALFVVSAVASFSGAVTGATVP